MFPISRGKRSLVEGLRASLVVPAYFRPSLGGYPKFSICLLLVRGFVIGSHFFYSQYVNERRLERINFSVFFRVIYGDPF